jgi:aminopeptidase-like protein
LVRAEREAGRLMASDGDRTTERMVAGNLPDALGESMHSLIRDLYPLHRSITGQGVRATLARLQEVIDLSISEVPSGSRVFDWVVPNEWSIRDAYIESADGSRVVDYRASNLHVVSYSTPVDRVMTLRDLRPHLHSLPDQPDWIPFRNAYYQEGWGFCLAHRTLADMAEGNYRVVIDSELTPGSLTYAECVIRGETDDEVLIFTHVCHPSLCNDNLSGVAVATFLAEALSRYRLRYTYRFVFAPTTIGSITWLARNEDRFGSIRHGLVLAVIGDSGNLVYKRSRRANAEIDRAAEHVLATRGGNFEVRDFSPWGYDERQFCSPGIDLPLGRLSRTPHGEFPEYHTSADDLSIVRPQYLLDSLRATWQILSVLEGNDRYLNKVGKGEPQLGRRGLYSKVGGHPDVEQHQLAMLWVLNQSDGRSTLLDIAEKAKLPFGSVRAAADDLSEAGLLAFVSRDDSPAD